MGEATTNERKGKSLGYESRLHIVNKTDRVIDVYSNDLSECVKCQKKWGELLATINLCCLGGECYPLWHGNATDCTFSDGNEYVLEDCYGEPLTEHTVSETIELLERSEANNHYRRLAPAIAYLRGINEAEFDNIVVLHYGY